MNFVVYIIIGWICVAILCAYIASKREDRRRTPAQLFLPLVDEIHTL